MIELFLSDGFETAEKRLIHRLYDVKHKDHPADASASDRIDELFPHTAQKRRKKRGA